MDTRIVIVGGGAAGLFAGALLGAARRAGKINGRILLLERHERVGRKLLATGNGRCNFANARPELQRFHHVEMGGEGRMAAVLAAFPLEDTLAAWRGLGVMPVEEGEGKLYPASGQASAVLDLLRIECERHGVDIRCGAEVTGIGREAQEDRIGIQLISGRPVFADAALLATGGEASPKLGGRAEGYALLEGLGHCITSRYPAIVPLETETQQIRVLRGCKVQARMTLMEGEHALRQETGELLFTEYGLSGPPALQLAEAFGAAKLADARAMLCISIDLLPAWGKEELLLAMQLRLAEQGYRKVEDFMTGWLHKQVARATAKAAGIDDLSRSSYSLSAAELERWAALLKGWRIPVTGSRGMDWAQVTAGGAVLGEFDDNLQSLKCPGLYACGELLDVHGDSGGFNLQWAWSSAAACVRGICQQLGS